MLSYISSAHPPPGTLPSRKAFRSLRSRKSFLVPYGACAVLVPHIPLPAPFLRGRLFVRFAPANPSWCPTGLVLF